MTKILSVNWGGEPYLRSDGTYADAKVTIELQFNDLGLGTDGFYVKLDEYGMPILSKEYNPHLLKYVSAFILKGGEPRGFRLGEMVGAEIPDEIDWIQG